MPLLFECQTCHNTTPHKETTLIKDYSFTLNAEKPITFTKTITHQTNTCLICGTNQPIQEPNLTLLTNQLKHFQIKIE
jgi:hypothetical protein